MPRSAKLFRLSPRLWAGLALVILPGTLTLLAEDKPKAKPATTTSRPATTVPNWQKIREQRKEAEITRVMDFFRVTQPDVYEQAKMLRATDPERFEKLVRPTIGTVNKLEDLRKKSPKLFDLTMKDLELNYHSLRLARQLKRADLPPADRERFGTELSGVVSNQFDIRQQIRQQEIEDLKGQLKDLDVKLQANEKSKDALIKKRVDDLIEKPPRLDW